MSAAEDVDLVALRERVKALVAEAEAAARDPGVIVARVPRYDGTELRVSVHRRGGRPMFRVGLWKSTAADAAPCSGKAVTVRPAEAATVAAGLLDALRATGEAPPAR